MLRKLTEGIRLRVHLQDEDGYPEKDRAYFTVRLMTQQETVEYRVGLQALQSETAQASVFGRAKALSEYYCNRFSQFVEKIENPGEETLADQRSVYDFAWHFMTNDQVIEILMRVAGGSATREAKNAQASSPTS
jgi:hypothetical protein